jgi:hypothetical protein
VSNARREIAPMAKAIYSGTVMNGIPCLRQDGKKYRRRS